MLAEHGAPGAAVGAIFDGTGYGPDGTVWGGEFLCGDLAGFARVGMLLSGAAPRWRPGDPAAVADGLLVAGGLGSSPPPALHGRVDGDTWQHVTKLAQTGLASPVTTSMGRLFDAVAALCGLRLQVNYEGQAAIELEAVCDPAERDRYPISLERDGGMLVIDPRETIRTVAADVAAAVSVGIVAARFHAAAAHATVQACAEAASAGATDRVVLSGGVFQNRRLLEAVAAGLHSCGAARAHTRAAADQRRGDLLRAGCSGGTQDALHEARDRHRS